VQRQTIEAQHHFTTAPNVQRHPLEAQRHFSFAQNSLNLSSFPHFLTLCLPNENAELENEM